MRKYIDGDTVFNELTSRYKTAKGEARKAYREALDIVTAVDDIEVQHGRWLHLRLDPDNITGHTKGECSICGKLRIVDNYCPNCGALMVSEDE